MFRTLIVASALLITSRLQAQCTKTEGELNGVPGTWIHYDDDVHGTTVDLFETTDGKVLQGEHWNDGTQTSVIMDYGYDPTLAGDFGYVQDHNFEDTRTGERHFQYGGGSAAAKDRDWDDDMLAAHDNISFVHDGVKSGTLPCT